MSDGLDPKHGPYGAKRQINLDEWCEELVLVLFQKGYLNERKPSVLVRMLPDIREFARTVVQATKDGRFDDIQ